MPFQVRSSKFRHVYGRTFKREQCYDNLKITKLSHDGTFCAVNPLFLAVVSDSIGGGSFTVLPLEKCGRIDSTYKICGHKASVLDLKWNKYDDHVIASCSEDCTIKIWQIPNGGLRSNLTDYVANLKYV